MKNELVYLWVFFFVPSLCPLCLCGYASAALDPELNKPYQVQVVLHVAENRFLTPLFKDNLEQELVNQLRWTFGPLAKVEVARSHPLLRTVLERGLEAALEGWEELSSRQTHFVLVDFAAGYYELQSRQHDGSSGLSSPQVRRVRTSDRRLVGRLATQLVEQDFGLVGTVVEVGKEIKLAIKGGGLGVPLGPWLKTGQVFVISRLTQEGEHQRAARLSWAVLEVLAEPQAGYCRCRLWHRFLEDRLDEGPGILGYRCLQWPTTRAPVRIQVLDSQGVKPLEGLRVQVRSSAKGGPVRELTTNAAGLAITPEGFNHLALVRVFSGTGLRAQFPVEIIGPRTVVCRLQLDSAAEGLALLEYRKDLWLRRIYDDLSIASERVGELNQQLGQSLAGALEAARAGHKTMAGELAALTIEREHLQRQALTLKKKLDWREGELRLAELQGKQAELERFIGRLENVLQEAKSDQAKVQAKLLERARLLESEADFDSALKLYDQFLQANPEQPHVQAHRHKLFRAWGVKSPEHAQARVFIYQTWPRLDVAGLRTQLDKAFEALKTCRQAGDSLTPLKLLQANVRHAGALKKRLETLRRQDSEDNRNEARAIGKMAESLGRLHLEATALAKKN